MPQEDAELPTGVSGSMRKEMLVMVACAPFADRNGCAGPTSLLGEDGPEVERRGAADACTSNRKVHFRPNFITLPTDRGTEVHQNLRCGDGTPGELVKAALEDSGGGSLPTAVQNRADA